MKTRERNLAIALRKQGISMGEIAETIGVSKGSVSYWVREIHLSAAQRKRLNNNGHSVEAIEKRRIARLANTRKKREEIMKKAAEEVHFLQRDPLWSIGTALYWGEGGKTQQTARIANSDPAVIKISMRYFRETCKIPESKFRGHVHTFSHLNAREAERYWSEISGLPIDKFYKTYVKQSKASKKKRETLPYGTFQIYVHDSIFFFRLMGWIKKLEELGK